jgi:hypothetical protein
MHCDDDITGNVSETATANKKKEDPTPRPLPQYTYSASRIIKLWKKNLPKLLTKKTTSPKHCITVQ